MALLGTIPLNNVFSFMHNVFMHVAGVYSASAEEPMGRSFMHGDSLLLHKHLY